MSPLLLPLSYGPEKFDSGIKNFHLSPRTGSIVAKKALALAGAQSHITSD